MASPALVDVGRRAREAVQLLQARLGRQGLLTVSGRASGNVESAALRLGTRKPHEEVPDRDEEPAVAQQTMAITGKAHVGR